MQRTERPWGWYENLVADQDYLVKRLWIAPGQRLSLQRHRHRQEHWYVAAGSGVVHIDGHDHTAEPGSSFNVPCRAVHRASGSDQGLLIVEIQRGPILSEDDIERLADDYGRPQSAAG
ncbi:MAG: phosphomannose isomerase type II C-terminal cupin domain [Synechococcus sp.]|nr:phosphomannose isomerase type II C-terminal cupin domain [Synechococcus sp.]